MKIQIGMLSKLHTNGTRVHTINWRLLAITIGAISCSFCLSSCGNQISSLSGEMEFRVQGGTGICAQSIGDSGTLKSGSGEILGTIAVSNVVNVEEENLGDEFGLGKVTICSVALIAKEINVDVDVLVVDFNTLLIRGNWILPKSEFSDTEINLTTIN